LADAGAMKYLSHIGVHWYWDNLFPLDLLDQTHDLFPDKIIINSEASFNHRSNYKEKDNIEPRDADPVHLGSWFRGENLAERMIDVSSFMDTIRELTKPMSKHVSDRKTRLTIVYGAIHGSIVNFHSSLGVLLCDLRPDIDTLLCSIGLECVQKKEMWVSW